METLLLASLLAVIAIIIICYGTVHNRRIRRYEISRIREGYGKPNDREYKEGEYAHIQGYYRVHSMDMDDCPDDGVTETCRYRIDDITWNDLNMDDIYRSIDRCQSSAGDEYLYYLLRDPRKDVCDRDRFEELVSYYSDNADDRLSTSVLLHDIGRTGKYSIYDYINNLDALSGKTAFKDWILLAVYAVAITACIVSGDYARGISAAALIFALMYGGISYFARKREIEPYVVSFSYILRLLKGAALIIDKGDDKIDIEKGVLKEASSNMAGFARMSGMIMNSSGSSGNPLEIVIDYLKMFTHIDIIKFFSMRDDVNRHRDDIDRLLTSIGFIDTSIAVASYRSFLGTYCIPEFGGTGIEASGLFHPLLEEPVANDLNLSRGMLLTGSNASGKSTMLRTITVAALLAQSIGTVPAASYRAPFFRIYTSLSLNDSILTGESYYMTEIRALKRIVDAGKEEGLPILAAVDEVLRGTNTVERISASTAIMRQLAVVDGIILAATHDLELTELLDDMYDNYHFEETIENDDISFAYKLLPGRATTRNAIRLLDIMGYDKELISEAEKMAEGYMQSGEYMRV